MKKDVLFSFLVSVITNLVFTGFAWATPIISNGIIAAYEFNGNAHDSAGSNDGVVVGATLTTDRNGTQNSAYYFDGLDDYISLDPIFNVSQEMFTYSAWIYIDPSKWDPNDSIGSIYGEFTPEGATRNFFCVHNYGGGSIAFDQYPPDNPEPMNSGGNYIPADLNNLTGQWIHIALTMEDDLLRGYVNGTLVGTSIYSEYYSGPDPTITSTGARIIGGTWDNNYAFEGCIDNLYLYERALSSNEIKKIYKSEAPVPEPATIILLGAGLIGLARFKRYFK